VLTYALYLALKSGHWDTMEADDCTYDQFPLSILVITVSCLSSLYQHLQAVCQTSHCCP